MMGRCLGLGRRSGSKAMVRRSKVEGDGSSIEGLGRRSGSGSKVLGSGIVGRRLWFEDRWVVGRRRVAVGRRIGGSWVSTCEIRARRCELGSWRAVGLRVRVRDERAFYGICLK